MQGLAVWVADREVAILVYEAFGFLLEGADGVVIPPVRVVACLIVVAAVGIESCIMG